MIICIILVGIKAFEALVLHGASYCRYKTVYHEHWTSPCTLCMHVYMCIVHTCMSCMYM